MSAVEFARLRANTVSLVLRKSGFHHLPQVTVGRAEMASQWPDLLHRLPQTSLTTHQNNDGTFRYLPGWDGPLTPAG